MQNKLENIYRLEQWISDNGFAGFGPYDLRDWLMQNNIPKFLWKFFFGFELLFPLSIRKILNIKCKENAKAIGLLFTSYVNLYKFTSKKIYLDKAEKCKKWLLNNYAKTKKGIGWGYPFDWDTIIFIPKGTPSSVVSYHVGEGFWNYYKLKKDKKALEVCNKICEFFINDLKIDQINKNIVCFSYTPLDNFHVHNSNLFVAEFLIKVGKEINNKRYVNLGKKAVNYTISEQRKNGLMKYWGDIQSKYDNRFMDHFHTGFELRMLYSISKLTKSKKYLESFDKLYNFYRKNYFNKKLFPKWDPENLYPLDIHTFAEAILCNCYFKEKFNEKITYNLIEKVSEIMRTKEGWYIYLIDKKFGIKFKWKIPYLRWGQAWMLRAFSEYLLRIKKN